MFTKKDFLDKTKVKIIDGIAGSGKSTYIAETYRKYHIPYVKYCSTNKLKKDSDNRFKGNNDTIAGGLFVNNGYLFYIAEKQPECKEVVIDEILQANPKALDWVEHNKGEYNIIILTDSRQMLELEQGKLYLKHFLEFTKRDDVLYKRITKTLRARDEKTKQYMEYCYKEVEKDTNLFIADKDKFKNISYKDMPYNQNDVYIVHNNNIEEDVYNRFDLYNNYNNKLIPKGKIARLELEDYSKYKILPQNKVKGKNIGYMQVENVATATRYQGSEVTENQKLYYIVDSNSVVYNREWYTTISRLYYIDNLIIVNKDKTEQEEQLKKYNGKRIKLKSVYTLTDDNELLDNKEDKVLSKEELKKLIPYDRKVYYDKSAIWYKGKKFTSNSASGKQKNQITIGSLLKRECDFDYNMEYIYKVVDENRGDMLLQCNLGATRINNDKSKTEYKYGIDLKSAYPHILSYAKLPINRETTEKTKIYLTIEDFIIPKGRLIFEDLYNELSDEDKAKCKQILEYPYKIGSEMGNYLLTESKASYERNQKIKGIHYGFIERKYLEGIEYSKKTKEASAYVINSNNNHGLLMIAIKSELLRIMFKIKKVIYNNYYQGNILVDCLYFDYEGDIELLGDKLKKEIYPYDFRIFTNTDEKTKLYQTYEDLKTNREIKTEKQRERRKEERERKRNKEDC